MGWSGWIFDANLMLMWANLSPAVVYEETLLRDGFKDIKVLVLPHCDVLTEPVFRAVVEFQGKGGILVANEYIVPGITPDIPTRSITRSGDPKKDKEALHRIGKAWRVIRIRSKTHRCGRESDPAPDSHTDYRHERRWSRYR